MESFSITSAISENLPTARRVLLFSALFSLLGALLIVSSPPAAAQSAVETLRFKKTSVEAATTTLTFTPENWKKRQKIAIRARLVGDDTVSVTHVATSADPKYDNVAIAPVSVTIEALETPGAVTNLQVSAPTRQLRAEHTGPGSLYQRKIEVREVIRSIPAFDAQTAESGATMSPGYCRLGCPS